MLFTRRVEYSKRRFIKRTRIKTSTDQDQDTLPKSNGRGKNGDGGGGGGGGRFQGDLTKTIDDLKKFFIFEIFTDIFLFKKILFLVLNQNFFSVFSDLYLHLIYCGLLLK